MSCKKKQKELSPQPDCHVKYTVKLIKLIGEHGCLNHIASSIYGTVKCTLSIYGLIFSIKCVTLERKDYNIAMSQVEIVDFLPLNQTNMCISIVGIRVPRVSVS